MKLLIESPGHVFSLPGKGLIKTPCNIDVSHISINSVISILKVNGVMKYKINEEPIKIKNKGLPKNISVVKGVKQPKVIIQQVEDPNSSKEISKLSKKIDSLETFLSNISKKLDSPKTIIKESSTTCKVEKAMIIDDDDDDEFIPEINFDDLEMNKSKTIEVEIDDNSLSSNADILRELQEGGNSK